MPPFRRAKADVNMNYESGFAKTISEATPYAADDARPKSGRLWMVIAAIIAVAVLAAAYFMFTRDDAPAGAKTAASGKAAGKDEKQAPRVTVVTPGRQPVENIVTATGTLAARRDMPVGAVGEGGLVQRVLVDPGQWVQAGQVLATVDRQVQAQQSNQLAAQINVAQADARLAQAELDRALALVKRGFISKADIDRKTATRDAAYARVRVAQAQFSENRARIGRLDIRAPASGRVLTRSVEPGQVVGAGGAPLFRIAKDGEMELHAQMAEADLAKMAVGYRATVTPVGSAQAFSGQIWQLSPVIDPQSRQGMVRIALGSSPALRPGGFASASISSGSIDAPLLPESAVLSDAKGNYVFLANGANKVERRDVRVGSVTDGGVSIIEGLAGTEQVILSAGGFLNPGESIIPDRTKPAR
jgi:RND family efflux transporter MFP subunit